MIKLSELIKEMEKVKADYPSLEISEILRIFHMQSTRDLTNQIRRLASK